MKAFVITDIHGHYDEMIKALDEKGFEKDNHSHFLISLGDATDRGPKNLEVLKFINSIPKERKILIKGNHEDMIEEIFQSGYIQQHNIRNGTLKTLFELSGIDEMDEKEARSYSDSEIIERAKNNKEWIDYENCLVDYFETPKYIFVHGWIPTKLTESSSWDISGMVYDIDVKHQYNPYWRTLGIWDGYDGAMWLNGMKMWSEGIREPDKIIFCGHYHTSWGHSRLHNDGKEYLDKIETYYIDPETGKTEPHVNWDPFVDDDWELHSGIRALDACTILSHQVNVWVIDNFEDELV